MTRTYRGVLITPFASRNSSGFRWTAYTKAGFLHAGTLTRLRELIRHTLQRTTP